MAQSLTTISWSILSEADNVSLTSNNNDNSTCLNFDNSTPTVAGQLLMSIAILILNLLVVAAICRNRRRTFRKPAFIFIVALAVTDMVLAVCLICFTGVAISQLHLSAEVWVNLTASTSVCFNASVNFLLVIALDRLCFIAYNHSYTKLMHNRNVFLLIVLCWVVGMLPVLPLFFWKVGSCAEHCSCYENQFLTCSHPSCSTVLKGFTKQFLFGMFFYFLIMLFSITIIYVSLFWKVKLQANRVRRYSKESTPRGRSSRMRREFRLARTLTVVVVTFFLCWSPLMLLYVVDFATSDSFVINTIVAQTIMTPAVFNSMLNPLIYAARIPILKSYFCFCGCKISKESTTDKKSQRSSESSSRKCPTQPTNKQQRIFKINPLYKRTTNDIESCCSSSRVASQVSGNTYASNQPSPKEGLNAGPVSSANRVSCKRPSSELLTMQFKQNYISGKRSNIPNKDYLRSSIEICTIDDESSIAEVSSHKHV